MDEGSLNLQKAARERAYSMPLEEIEVADPALFETDTMWPYFERLRKEDPVHHSVHPEHGPYWSVTKYNDIMAVDTNHEVFSSEPAITIFEPADDFTMPMFIAMDPPKHDEQRKTVSPAVAPHNLEMMEPIIRERAGGILDSLPIGEEFDWVDKVSIELTTMTLATLFDFPWEERRKLTYWSDLVVGGPAIQQTVIPEGVDPDMYWRGELFKMVEYFQGLWNDRVGKEGGTDLISMLAHNDSTRGISMDEYHGTVVLLIIGGNDTTRNTISGSVYELNRNPDQYAMLRANPALVRLNGYESEAEMLANVNDIAAEWYVNPARRDEFSHSLAEQGSVAYFESEIYRHKSRERIWISETAILVRDSEGRPLYYQGTVEDISKRKQIEQEQEYLMRQLAQAVRMKDEFLASMSHELRTPLNSILGMAESLQEGIYGPLNPRQHKAVTTIEASGLHLLALINDILDLAKIEARGLDLAYDWVDVKRICQECLGLIQPVASKKHLQVLLNLDDHVTVFQADERRLKQILLNLLSNAVKFTPENGTIDLSVIGDQEHAAIRFTVCDTGVGIAHEAMARLFKPFVQLDSSLGRQHEGTGLGLALVYRMVELQGGSVTVESEVGQGSRFTVHLPWIEPAANNDASSPKIDIPNTQACHCEPAIIETEAAYSATAKAARPLILLADDNHFTVHTVADYLRCKQFQVETVSDGVQALAKARLEKPALILMDLQMPGMDGLSLLERLNALFSATFIESQFDQSNFQLLAVVQTIFILHPE